MHAERNMFTDLPCLETWQEKSVVMLLVWEEKLMPQSFYARCLQAHVAASLRGSPTHSLEVGSGPRQMQNMEQWHSRSYSYTRPLAGTITLSCVSQVHNANNIHCCSRSPAHVPWSIRILRCWFEYTSVNFFFRHSSTVCTLLRAGHAEQRHLHRKCNRSWRWTKTDDRNLCIRSGFWGGRRVMSLLDEEDLVGMIPDLIDLNTNSKTTEKKICWWVESNQICWHKIHAISFRWLWR